MKFFSYQMDENDDVVSHITKLKNIWKDLKVELERDENSDLLLMCQIIETLPDKFFSFASSWRLLNKTERTVGTLTNQLCSYERALAGKSESSKNQEVLFARASSQKSSQRLKNQKQNKLFNKSTGLICHYCKAPGHIVRNCEKWNSDGKPPKPRISNRSEVKEESLVVMESSVFVVDESEYADEWFFDNGATCHLTFRRNIFQSFDRFSQPNKLHVANGDTVEAVGKGVVQLQVKVNNRWQTVKLTDVWYVPKVKRNLFSVIATQDKNRKSSFVSTSRSCYLIVNNKKIVVGTRDNNGGLFKLTAKTVRPFNSDAEVNFVNDKDALQLYHERMGHQNKKHVKMVIKRELNIDVGIDSELCEGCVYGKLHRLKFGTRVRASRPGELIHADVCGPFCFSFSNVRYFVLFKDDFSGYRFVYFLKEKSQVSQKLQQMLAESRTIGHKVSEFLSDNGGEFDNKEVRSILQKEGVRQRLTMPYTPQQNGCSERENRTLVEAARAMRLAHEELPQALWAELINTAAYILNRTGPSSIEGKSPYELWFNKKPKIKHLRIIGSTAYAHIPIQKRRKFDTKAKKGILVGYEGDDGYRIFVRQGNKMYRSRDVVFDEKVIKSNVITLQERNCSDNSSSVGGEIKDEKKELLIEENSKDVHNSSSISTDEEDEPDCCNQKIEGMVLRDRKNIQKPSRYDDFIMTALCEVCEPESYEDAVHSENKDEWLEAMNSEMRSLKENQTWDLEYPPKGRKIIPCKWVYKIKNNPDGSVERFKARLVIKGFSQEKGIDYEETFSPVVRSATIRTLIGVAACEKMSLMQFDVSTAFLYSKLDEEIYMEQPKGFKDNSGRACKLKGGLYGLKQAPRCWNKRFAEFLIKRGFKQSDADPCLFIRKQGEKKLMLALYVDDGLVAGTDKKELQEFEKELKSEFKITAKPASYFLGLEINRDAEGNIKVGQSAYAKKILEKFGMSRCRPCSTPITKSEKESNGNETEQEDVKFPYRSAVGALMYLMTGTRPDIAYAVGVASRSLENPSRSNVTQVKQMFRYLQGTADVGIVYKSGQSNALIAYSDADHGGDVTSGRSTSGVICMFAGGVVSWLSQRQASVAISTTEAEIVAASEAAREVVWLKRLLNDIVELKKKPEIFVDNEAAIRLAHNPVLHRRTKHILIRHFFVREKVSEGEVSVERVTTGLQVADALTKPMLGPRLKQLLCMMGLE